MSVSVPFLPLSCQPNLAIIGALCVFSFINILQFDIYGCLFGRKIEDKKKKMHYSFEGYLLLHFTLIALHFFLYFHH